MKPKLDPVLKGILTIRALQSEEDIKAGRVYTVEEVRKRLEQKTK